MKLLLRSIRQLGLRQGFRYWRISRQMAADPSLQVRAATSLALESARVRESDPFLSEVYSEVSAAIVAHYNSRR